MLKRLILSLAAGAAGVGALSARGAEEFRTGFLKVEIWQGISGTNLAALTSDSRYPANPDESRYVKFAEFPAGADDGTKPDADVFNEYGWKLSGFVLPKTNGNYVFYVAGADSASLWLSANDTSTNLTQIALEPQWNPVRSWSSTARRPGCPDNGGTNCNNRSAPIRLEAGKRYYMEALAKAGGGGDNLAVTMIPEGGIAPVDGDTPTLTGDLIGTPVETTVVIKTEPQDVKAEVGQFVSFSVVATAAIGTTFQWFKNGTEIQDATSASYTTPKLALADDGAKFKVKVTAANSVESREAVLTVVARDRSANIKGFLRADYYTGIPGASVDDFRYDPKFPDQPDVVEYVSLAESRTGFGVNYGVRLSGWIIADESGLYQFAVAAGGNAELFLSPSDNSASAVAIATEPIGNAARAFGTATARPGCPDACENVSGPIQLEAGKRYYLEALAKVGEDGGNLAVTWFKEGSIGPTDGALPLSSAFLETASNKNLASEVTITKQPQSATAQVNESVSFSVAATINPVTATTYIWHKDGKPIAGGTSPAYAINAVQTSDAGAYTCVISVVGRSVTSAEATLTVGSVGPPPTGSKIAFERTTTGLRLTYTGTLQSADGVAGPYSDVAGATSPATIPFSGTGKFYRLKP